MNGYVDPYSDPDSGCDGVHAGKLWACQAIISFSTLLLGVAVVFRCNISLQVPPRTLMLPGLANSVASLLPLPGGHVVEGIISSRWQPPASSAPTGTGAKIW